MSKECEYHEEEAADTRRRIFARILVFLFIVLLVILIIWAVLRPAKPQFILHDATVIAFNLSSMNTLTSTFQVTVVSRNPNDRIGVYYDRLLIYATYRDQQITFPTAIPPTYQDTKGISIWSPFVLGVSAPIAPFIGTWLNIDKNGGGMMMHFKMDGKVRWKVGAFVSGPYRFHVNCPAFIYDENPSTNGMVIGNNVVKARVVESCSVSV